MRCRIVRKGRVEKKRDKRLVWKASRKGVTMKIRGRKTTKSVVVPPRGGAEKI